MSCRWHRTQQPASTVDLAAGLLAMKQQEARCQAGDHREQTVPADRVVYAAGGRRRPTGERYCGFCGARFPSQLELRRQVALAVEQLAAECVRRRLPVDRPAIREWVVEQQSPTIRRLLEAG